MPLKGILYLGLRHASFVVDTEKTYHMTAGKKPGDADEPVRSTPASGRTVDSVAWTGFGDPPPLTQEELTGSLVYRVTDAGDRRTSRWLTVNWSAFGFLAVITIGTALAFASGYSGRSGAITWEVVLGLFVLPPALAFFGYVLWTQTATHRRTAIGSRVLRIDDHGFEDTRLHTGHVAWSAVKSIGAEQAAAERFSDWASHVSIELAASAANTMRGRDGKPVGRIMIWATPLGVDGYRLARVMEARWRAALASGA